MKIIVEGHEIDTLDIWDIEHVVTTRKVAIIIRLNGREPIILGRSIPYETRTGEFQKYWSPYDKLYKDLKEKWDADKTQTPIFKLS